MATYSTVPYDADVQAMVDSYDAYDTSPGFTSDCSVYRDLMIAAPLIPRAMDWAGLESLTPPKIWEQIDYHETNGSLESVSHPPGMPTDTWADYSIGSLNLHTLILISAADPGANKWAISADETLMVVNTTNATYDAMFAGFGYGRRLVIDDTSGRQWDLRCSAATDHDGWHELTVSTYSKTPGWDAVPLDDTPMEVDQTTIELSDTYARMMYAQKVAHALQLEVNKTYAWRVTSYSESELRLLLNAEVLFRYDGYGPASWFPYMLDYSPAEAHSKASGLISGTDNVTAAFDKISRFGHTMRHFTTGDNRRWVADLDETVSTIPMVARDGCKSMAPIFSSLARSVNIPMEDGQGYWANNAHYGAWCDAAGHRWSHADHVYEADSRGHRGLAECVTVKTYEDDIGIWEEWSQTAVRESYRAYYKRLFAQPDPYLTGWFADKTRGWIDIVNTFGWCFTYTEMSTFYGNLAELTQHDGGVISASAGMGAVTVDMTGTPSGARWRLPIPIGLNYVTGDDQMASYSFTAELGEHTVTWLDTAAGYNPPAAEDPKTLAAGGAITFGPPVYTAE